VEAWSAEDFFFLRDVRLLGFAPVCDPYPEATSHGTDPASGFASCRVVDACLRMRSGSTPIESSASGIPRPHVRVRTARPYPLMGLQLLRRLRTGVSRPFSVLMGLMPCRPERLRGPSRACSLSEVLHRP
jgi:hypothetical protein